MDTKNRTDNQNLHQIYARNATQPASSRLASFVTVMTCCAYQGIFIISFCAYLFFTSAASAKAASAKVIKTARNQLAAPVAWHHHSLVRAMGSGYMTIRLPAETEASAETM